MAASGDARRWDTARRAEAYTELDHPSDLFLEIRGRDPAELARNALFALYDQIAELDGFDTRRRRAFDAGGATLDEGLRSLLAEALYLFDTEGFVAAGGRAEARPPGGRYGSAWRFSARLWGDRVGEGRHTLLHEVKAVTYHRLSAELVNGIWKATILLDV